LLLEFFFANAKPPRVTAIAADAILAQDLQKVHNDVYLYPKDRQTTLAAASVNPSSHTVPQLPL